MLVRVTPRANRTAVGGMREGRLLVRVTAPAAEGRANAAVVSAVASALDLPRGAVLIVRGERSRDKELSIPLAARARLETLADRRT